MERLGELAALGTALLWAFTAIFFTEAGKRIGSYRVNKLRLIVAFILYAGALWVATGSPYPEGINIKQLGWLALSGFVGLVIGDSCGFKALVMIGPRLMSLIYATSPIITTIVAWIFLGERLTTLDLIGMALTISGVVWVVLERRPANNGKALDSSHPDAGSLRRGLLLAFIAACGQGIGLILAKEGMFNAGSEVAALPAGLIRICSGIVFLWGWAAFRGEIPQTLEAAKNKAALGFASAGALFGPFLGIVLSLIAIKYIPVGIASTLNSTSPLLIIPLVMFFYKEKVSLRALAGAVLVVGGVALLFAQ